jgi:Glycosyl transferases group 1
VRILFLSDFCPWPLDNGYRQRVYQLVQSLSRRHEVTLATVMPDTMRDRPFPPADHCVDLIPLSDADCALRVTGRFERWAPVADQMAAWIGSPFPNVVQRWNSPGISRILGQLYRAHSYDVVWAERPFIAELARAAGFRRIVLDLPDVETILLGRSLASNGWYPSKALHWLELAKLYAYDQTLPLRFWRLVVCKEADRRFYRTRRSNVLTLPNGVDEHPASPHVADTSAPQLLFLGALNYDSNVDAVRLLAASILPLIRREHPGARLTIIGRDPLPEIRDLDDGHGCVVLSDVDDLTPHFDAASWPTRRRRSRRRAAPCWAIRTADAAWPPPGESASSNGMSGAICWIQWRR